jgi:hypothetical protein
MLQTMERRYVKKNYLILTIFIVLVSQINQINSLICYSCSTEAGDANCSEDGFNANLTATVECPPNADVCVRAIQMSNANPNANNVGTVVFRSCGSSSQSKAPEMTNLGYAPNYNMCLVHKISSSFFAGSTFEICSCSRDLGNSKGEIKCK